MNKKSLQNLLIALLLILPAVALAQSRNSMDLYRKHHDQLPESHRAHQRFLMQDGARAMRVLEKYGWLDESSRDAKAPTTDDAGENGTETEAAGTIALNKAASGLKSKDLAAQLHTAASEIQAVATALQRAPLPPDGFWLKHAQGLKKSSARLARLAARPDAASIPPLVARVQSACYECHRVYGGPLDSADLLASGDVDYEKPFPAPTVQEEGSRPRSSAAR